MASINDRNEVRLALRTTTTTIELGSLLDREGHVMNVAGYLGNR
jgi:hypothetical protein